MNILLINPLIPNKMKMLDYADDMTKKSILRRVLIGPPLALNELAGTVPNENVMILDQKSESESTVDYDAHGQLVATLEAFKPDFVGITCLTAQFNTVKQMVALIKAVSPKTFVLVGGLHVTLCPQDFVGVGVDVLSIGLGKWSFREVITALKQNFSSPQLDHIYGLAIPRGANLHYTQSMSKLTHAYIKSHMLLDEVVPNRQLTEKYKYTIPPNYSIHYISTSQGCTHRCNFCSIWPTTHGKFFPKNNQLIIDELKTMTQYDVIRFCDANSFAGVKETEALFKAMIDQGLNRMKYIIDVRVDTVLKYPQVMQLAREAGVEVAICGLESVDDAVLKRYEKKSSVKDIEEALKILNHIGIKVNGNYIVEPTFTLEDFDKLAAFVDRNPIFNSGFTILTPFPGTAQWHALKDQIVNHDLDYYNLTTAVTKTHLPERDFYEQVNRLYKISASAKSKFV